jgi:hypothetical protein
VNITKSLLSQHLHSRVEEIYELVLNEPNERPGVVTHTCNATYLGGEDHEGSSSRTAQAKVSETLSQQASWAWWFILVNPTYVLGRRRKI